MERNVPVERQQKVAGRFIRGSLVSYKRETSDLGVPGDLQGLGQKKSPGIRESDDGGTMRKLILR